MTNHFDKSDQSHVAAIRAEALRAFGEDEAERWLNTGWRVFNDRTPLDMARADEATVRRYIDNLTGAEVMLRQAAVPHRDK